MPPNPRGEREGGKEQAPFCPVALGRLTPGLSLSRLLFFLTFFFSWTVLLHFENQVRSLGREDPLAKEMVTHSSILAWRIPWREEPGRLQSMGSQRVGHD